MPTYDYRCTVCEHRFEAFQAMSADPLTDCPVCGGQVERLIGGGAGLVFKGSGFYITDYKSRKNELKNDKPRHAKPNEKSEKKKDN